MARERQQQQHHLSYGPGPPSALACVPGTERPFGLVRGEERGRAVVGGSVGVAAAVFFSSASPAFVAPSRGSRGRLLLLAVQGLASGCCAVCCRTGTRRVGWRPFRAAEETVCRYHGHGRRGKSGLHCRRARDPTLCDLLWNSTDLLAFYSQLRVTACPGSGALSTWLCTGSPPARGGLPMHRR